jgi:hypothetical protein
MKKLSQEEIEEIALRKLRNNSNKKLLSNVNVDCFCMGYKTCQNTLLDLSYNPDELAEYLLKHAEYAIDYVETSIAYAGGMQTEEDTKKLTFFKGLKNFLTKKE